MKKKVNFSVLSIFCLFLVENCCWAQKAALVKDIHSGADQSSDPGNFMPFQGKLLFTATLDSSHRDFWLSDGTLGYLFLGASAPKPPFPSCGLDSTLDDLKCSAFSQCGD